VNRPPDNSNLPQLLWIRLREIRFPNKPAQSRVRLSCAKNLQIAASRIVVQLERKHMPAGSTNPDNSSGLCFRVTCRRALPIINFQVLSSTREDSLPDARTTWTSTLKDVTHTRIQCAGISASEARVCRRRDTRSVTILTGIHAQSQRACGFSSVL